MRADKCPNCGAYLPAPRPGQTSIECEYCHVQVRLTRHVPLPGVARPPQPPQLAAVVLAMAAGLGVIGFVAYRTVAPRSFSRTQPKLAEKSPTEIDVSKAIVDAVPRVRELASDALLTSVYATLVRSDGIADFSLGSGAVMMSFRSPRASVPPAGAPVGSDVSLPCFAYDNYTQNYHNTYVTKGNPHDCGRPTVRPPICSVAQVWQRALAAGAPKNAVATVTYEAVTHRDFWNRRAEAMLYDTAEPVPGAWSLRISDSTKTHFSADIPDDCDGAAPPAPRRPTGAFQAELEKQLRDDRTRFWGCIQITRDRVRVRSRLRVGPGGDVASSETTILSARPKPADPAALASCVDKQFRSLRLPAPGAWTETSAEVDLYR